MLSSVEKMMLIESQLEAIDNAFAAGRAKYRADREMCLKQLATAHAQVKDDAAAALAPMDVDVDSSSSDAPKKRRRSRK